MFKSLNADQDKIVRNPKIGNVRIIAVPGSGKTRVMILRILYMIFFLDCDASAFLVLTFTSNASKEIIKRINSYISDSEITCGTIHAISKKFLNLKESKEIYHVDEFQYLFLNYLKTHKLSKIKYIFVDEYQDINEIQFAILQELYKQAETITVVGDDNQNIYGFRGSDIRYIREFDKHFPDVSTYYLSINYRSTAPLVAVANASVSHCVSLEKPAAQSARRVPDASPALPSSQVVTTIESPKPLLCHHYSIYESIRWMITDIKTVLRQGSRPETIAILSRNNYLLHFTDFKLTRAGIHTMYLSGDEYQRHLSTGKVVLSTIHGSKGLEWERVYVLGLHNEHFPDSRHPDIEAMRRLFYVAITRAKTHLILCNSSTCPSIFVSELPKDLFRLIGTYPEPRPFIPHPDVVQKIGVVALLRKLDGQDYQYMKHNLFPPYTHQILRLAQDVKKKEIGKIQEHRLFTEFGIFLEYLARRMLAGFHKDKSLLIDQPLQNCICGSKSSTRILAETKNQMTLAYHKYVDLRIDWKDCLLAIWQVSWAPSLLMGKQKVTQLVISLADLQQGNSIYERMATRLESWKAQAKHSISCVLESKTQLYGEIDFLRTPTCRPTARLSGKQIIDMKSEWNPNGMSALVNFIQILTYAAMCGTETPISSIAIYNVIYDRFVEWDLSNWTAGPLLLEYLNKISTK